MGFFERRRGRPKSLSMTPLIDVFSILVIFLLLQFNAGNLSEASSKNVLLPSSSAGRALSDLPAIYLSQDLAGQLIYKNEETKTSSALFLNHLRSWVKKHQGDLQHSGLNLFVDEKVPMKALKKVMATLRQASIKDVYFSVRNSDSD